MTVLSASSGGLTLKAAPTKKAFSACVMLSFNATGNQSSLSAMRHGCELMTTTGLHESAAFGAIVACAKARLAVNPADIVKMQTCHVEGHLLDGRGTVSLVCAPNRSALRKALNGFVASLAVPKLFNAYSNLIRSIGEPPERSYFDSCIGKLLSAIKGADVLLTGRFSVDSKTLKDLAGAVKWDKIPSVSGGSAPKVSKAVAIDKESKAVKINMPKGVAGYIIKSHIMKRIQGVRFCYHGKQMMVHAAPSKVEKITSKEYANDYAKKIAAVVKSHGIEPIIHVVAMKACGDAADLISDAGKTWNQSSLAVTA